MSDSVLVPVIVKSNNLPATAQDASTLKEQRKMLRDFVADELRENIDFGVIPGTKKPSLYKPGAEKLARLFGLGFRVTLSHHVIDPKENFAMFTYKAQVYVLQHDDVVVAECEASCNSKEKKYAERAVYVDNKPKKEATPIYDILNTLQKMSQKRAVVGAVILAVGASDFYTQDIDEPEDARQVGTMPEVRTTTATVPKTTNAVSKDQTQTGNPPCPSCNQPMGISKYENPNTGGFDFYCFKCKIKRVRE